MNENPATQEGGKGEQTLEDARRELFYLGESHRLEILILLAQFRHQFLVRKTLPNIAQYMISQGATSLVDKEFMSADGKGKFKKFTVNPKVKLSERIQQIANWFQISDQKDSRTTDEYMLHEMPEILRVVCEENRFRMLEFLQVSGTQTDRECIPYHSAMKTKNFHISQLRKKSLITRKPGVYAITPNREVYAGLTKIASVIRGDEAKE